MRQRPRRGVVAVVDVVVKEEKMVVVIICPVCLLGPVAEGSARSGVECGACSDCGSRGGGGWW